MLPRPLTKAQAQAADRRTYAAAEKALLSACSWLGSVEQDDVAVAIRTTLRHAWRICGERAAKPARFHFDAGSRLALRAGVSSLSARAVTHRRNRCTAPAPASCSITRHLRLPWMGGHVALARAAGVDRIEPGCNPLNLSACFAPAVDAGALDLLTLAA